MVVITVDVHNPSTMLVRARTVCSQRISGPTVLLEVTTWCFLSVNKS